MSVAERDLNRETIEGMKTSTSKDWHTEVVTLSPSTAFRVTRG